jgi:hypothetical protein
MRADAVSLRAKAPPDAIQVRSVEQIGALSADRTHERMNMSISETGDEGDAAAIDHARS